MEDPRIYIGPKWGVWNEYPKIISVPCTIFAPGLNLRCYWIFRTLNFQMRGRGACAGCVSRREPVHFDESALDTFFNDSVQQNWPQNHKKSSRPFSLKDLSPSLWTFEEWEIWPFIQVPIEPLEKVINKTIVFFTCNSRLVSFCVQLTFYERRDLLFPLMSTTLFWRQARARWVLSTRFRSSRGHGSRTLPILTFNILTITKTKKVFMDVHGSRIRDESRSPELC